MKFKDIVVLSESPEDEALLDRVESAKDQVRATTKNIKYDDTAIEIITAVGSIVDELNNEELKSEVEYLENAVFQAKNELESAVYGLEEPFDDLIRTLQNKIDDEEYDRKYGQESMESKLGGGKQTISEMPRVYLDAVAMFMKKNPGMTQTDFENAKKKVQDVYLDKAAKDHGLSEYNQELGEVEGDAGIKVQKNEASLVNPAVDAEFLNWLKAKGQDSMFPYRLGDMDRPESLEQMKQMYYKETGQLAGDGGTYKYGAPGSDRRNAYQESDDDVEGADYSQDGMIGTPDGYYDAEERQKAYRDLKDAKGYARDYEVGSLEDGICPECAGTGYADGDEYFINDDGEEEESSECNGWGDFGCDEGEMTQNDEGFPNWAEIERHDKRQMKKANRGPAPSKEQIMKILPRLHDEYVKSGRYNAFELGSILTQLYPELNKREAGSYVADFLSNFEEGKSPHKKGTTKYKKHMAAMHAGESITKGSTMSNVRINELSPARDNSRNEEKMAEKIRNSLTELGIDYKGKDVYELYVELLSVSTQTADLYKSVALNSYDVQLEEGTGRIRGIAAGILLLLGINQAMEYTSAKNTPLGQDLKIAAQQGGEDSDLAAYYYKNLDLYADASDERTLVNLKIKFDSDDRRYDPSRTDVEDVLRKQAKLPENNMNEAPYKDAEAADSVKDKRGKEFKFDLATKTFGALDGEKAAINTPLGKELMRTRQLQMRRTTPSGARVVQRKNRPMAVEAASKWTPQTEKTPWWNK